MYKTIIDEIKKNICLVCCHKDDKMLNPIIIPCGCVFCSYNHLEFYFKDKNPIKKEKQFVCYCAHKYEIKDLYKLGLIFYNKSYKTFLRKEVIGNLNNIFEKKCCQCLSEEVFDKDKKIRYKDNEEKEEEILAGYKELKHKLCKNCSEKINNRDIIRCKFCDKEHIFCSRK